MKHDSFGPEYLLEVSDPRLGMRGFLVLDNLALGTGKGGIRMTNDVSLEEVARLARTMTWKNSLAGLPFGGAKGGIVWDGGPDGLKKKFVQSYAKKISLFTPSKYVAGPDVNTGEREMQWFVEATKKWRSATGKPKNVCMRLFGKKGEKCGIPHEFGSTGFGVAHATKVTLALAGMDLKNTSIAIEGFGNVGSFAYKVLTEMGARVVAVSDREGSIYSENGFDFATLWGIAERRGSVQEYPGAKKLSHDDIFSLPVDVLIPASVTDVINEKNKDSIRAKVIVEAANIPMQESVENDLFERGILVVPDFVANAGGVISSYAEYRGYNPKRMFETVERKITQATRKVMKTALKQKKNPRAVAMGLAKERVKERTSKRS